MDTNLKNNLKINTKSFGNYKSLVFSLFIYVIAGLVVFFGGLPLYTSFTVKSTEIDSKKAEISILDKKIAQLEKAKDLKDTIEKDSALADQAVSTTVEIPIVMTMVQNIAKDSGVSLKAFSYAGLSFSDVGKVDETTAPAAPAKTATSTASSAVVAENDAFNMNLSITAKFDSVQTFIKSLEKYRRLIDISNVSYSLQKNNAENVDSLVDVISIQLLLKTYYKDFSNATTPIDIEKYLNTIQTLESMDYKEVDNSTITIGKDNPFSEDTSNTGATTSDDLLNTTPADTNTVDINTLDSTNEGDSSPLPTPVSSNSDEDSTQDVEANPDDLNTVLKDLLQQEGVQP